MIEKEIEVIKILLEGRGTSIREIAKLSRIDYKTTYYVVHNLSKEGIIQLRKEGNSYKVFLKDRYHFLVMMAEYKRREEILSNKTMRVIFNKLKQLNFPFITVLFGSFLNKKEYGDIDLMIVCEKGREGKVYESLSSLPLNLHLNFFSYEELTSMLKSKEFNVVSEALKNYVVLIGIEDFCRLVDNAE